MVIYHSAVVTAVRFHQRLVNGPGTKIPDHQAISGQTPSNIPVHDKIHLSLRPKSGTATKILIANEAVAIPIKIQLTSPVRITTT